ncbi:MAG TPA: hypothetical protein VEI01_26545 [Terriglobales bacterium]|nr:hypothetical protein [Terriglobales bacterium]
MCEPEIYHVEWHVRHSGVGAWFPKGLVEMFQSVEQPRLCNFLQFGTRESILPIAIDSDRDFAGIAFSLYSEVVVDGVPNHIVNNSWARPKERDGQTGEYSFGIGFGGHWRAPFTKHCWPASDPPQGISSQLTVQADMVSCSKQALNEAALRQKNPFVEA